MLIIILLQLKDLKVHGKGFPALKIGSRIVVPRDKFLAWIDANSGSKNAPL